MKLTKKIVDQLLAINVKNRKWAHGRVEAMARAMKDGLFIPNNGQSIVVNESWNWLLDGQHRLMAIAMAGYPVYDIDVKVIPDDIAEAAFKTIDVNHGSRTSGQILGLSKGLKNVNLQCAIVRAIAMFAWKETNLSVDELDRDIELLKDDIEFMMLYKTVCSKSVKASYLAGVINAMRIGDRNVVRGLWASICDSNIDKNHSALKSLVPYLVGATKETQAVQFFRTTNAMLHPELKKLYATICDDLRCRCPYEQPHLNLGVLSKAKSNAKTNMKENL